MGNIRAVGEDQFLQQGFDQGFHKGMKLGKLVGELMAQLGSLLSAGDEDIKTILFQALPLELQVGCTDSLERLLLIVVEKRDESIDLITVRKLVDEIKISLDFAPLLKLT